MRTPKRYTTYLTFVGYLLAVVLINVAGLTLFFRIDLTKNGIYSISPVSKEVVATLTEPLTINVFFTRNLPAPYNGIERYLRDLLEEYAVHANRFFNYRFYNVSPADGDVNATADANRKLAEDYGIRAVQVQAIEKDEVKFKKAYMGLVMIHGDMVERIATITSVNGLEYQLTTAVQKLNNKISALLGLEDKIRVTFTMSSSLTRVAPYMGLEVLGDYPKKIEQIVDTLNTRLYDRLEYTYVDPASDAEAAAAAAEHNLLQLKWPAISQGGVPAGNGVIGLAMAYGGEVRSIPVLQAVQIPIIGTQYDLMDLSRLEEALNENVETLVDINTDLGYLADHGTPDTSRQASFGGPAPDALTTFASLVGRNYSLKPIRLKEEAIPTGLGSLVIAGPSEPFSDYALLQIDQALMRGTDLILFLDAFRESRSAQQNMGFNQGAMLEPFDSGLEKLLEHYGVRIKKSIVLDENCHKQRMSRAFGGGEQAIYMAPVIKNENINHDLPFMRQIKGLVALKVSPLEPVQDRLDLNGITAHALVSSSVDSWEMRDRIPLNPMFMRPPATDEQQGRRTLAYLLEGRFTSYFDGKPLPAKPAPAESGDPAGSDDGSPAAAAAAGVETPEIEGTGGFLATGHPGRIFVMASADMLRDNLLSPQGDSPNDMFVLNVIDAVNDRADIAAMRSKVQRFNPLADTRAGTRTFIKLFNVIGLPLLVVIAGLLVMLRRHARRKQIQMIFQQ